MMPHARPQRVAGYWIACAASLLVATTSTITAATVASYVPSSRDEVLLTLDPAMAARDPNSLAALRARWQGRPHDVEAAADLAARYLDTGRKLGDERFTGFAHAVLSNWPADRMDVPVPDRIAILQARVLARRHQFSDAIDLLGRLVERSPGNARAWLDLSWVRLSSGDVAGAREACQRYGYFHRGLTALTCAAAIEGRSGQPEQAARELAKAMIRPRAVDAASRAFALGELADLFALIGDSQRALWWLEQARRFAPDDHALLIRLADHLLETGNHERARKLLAPHQHRIGAAVRYAIAANQSGFDTVGVAAIRSRLRAETMRGMRRPGLEARVALDLLSLPAEAVTPALDHFHLEPSPESARLALRAAQASGQPPPQAVVDWLARTGLRDARIQALLDRPERTES